MPWEVEYIPAAQRDLGKLDGHTRRLILKAVVKTAERPLPPPDGIGKPLGSVGGTNLSGCYKIKLRGLGYRVVYTLLREKERMRVIVISVRSDNEIYIEAARRLRGAK